MPNSNFAALTPDFPGIAQAGEAARVSWVAPHRSDALPATPPAPILSSAERRAARHAEIDRDARVVAEALHDALRRLAAPGAVQAPDLLWARTLEAVEASRAAHRALNNARITLRARRYTSHDDSAPLPASLRWFRHHGNYRGAFGSMAELGNCLRGVLGIAAGLPPAARVTIARELHLRGDIWTIEHEGAVHVFGRPGSSADLFLASERPQLAPQEAPAP